MALFSYCLTVWYTDQLFPVRVCWISLQGRPGKLWLLLLSSMLWAKCQMEQRTLRSLLLPLVRSSQGPQTEVPRGSPCNLWNTYLLSVQLFRLPNTDTWVQSLQLPPSTCSFSCLIPWLDPSWPIKMTYNHTHILLSLRNFVNYREVVQEKFKMSRVSMHEGQRDQREDGRKQRLRKKTLGSGHDKLCAWIPILYRDSNHAADLGIKEMSEWLLTATLSDYVGAHGGFCYSNTDGFCISGCPRSNRYLGSNFNWQNFLTFWMGRMLCWEPADHPWDLFWFEQGDF